MKILFMLLMIDYVLSYIGIRINIIEDANPLMVWLFYLPFGQGIIIRAIMSGLVLTPFLWLKTRCSYYNQLLSFIYFIYSFVMALHMRWIMYL